MKLLDLFRSSPSTLRNKPGGLAWVRGIEELDGRIVTTVRVEGEDFWQIDPPQQYVVQSGPIRSRSGAYAMPGDVVFSVAIVDRCLEPIPDTGITREEVERLYATGPTLVPLPIKEMTRE